VTWDRQTLAAAVPAAAVAVIAGVVSYGHIEALALGQHQTLAAARLLPLSVDMLIVAGSVVVLCGYWLGWLAVACGVAGTVFANVESGLPWGPLAATVAAWPAVSFTVASLVLERWMKRQVSRGGTGGTGVAGSEPSDTLSGYGNLPAPDQPEPLDYGNLPESSQCPHTVAGTPEQDVVQQYLHTRDCLGETPSQRRLAAAYGISRPKVAQLVGPLNGHREE